MRTTSRSLTRIGMRSPSRRTMRCGRVSVTVPDMPTNEDHAATTRTRSPRYMHQRAGEGHAVVRDPLRIEATKAWASSIKRDWM